MKISLIAASCIALVFCALLAAGCTSPTQADIKTIDTTVPTTTEPVTTVETTVVAVTTTLESIVPLPSAQYVDLELSKDRTNSKITLLYNGGAGQQVTQTVRMKVTLADGSVVDQLMSGGGTPDTGATIIVQGTRNGSDRCEVWVTSAGKVYKIIDENKATLNPYATTSSA